MSGVKVTREHREAAAQLTVKHSVPKHLVKEWEGRDAPLPQHIVDIGYFDPLLATVQALVEAEQRGAAKERAEIVAMGEAQADAYAESNNLDAMRGVYAFLSQINQRSTP